MIKHFIKCFSIHIGEHVLFDHAEQFLFPILISLIILLCMTQDVKNPPANAAELGSIPGSRRSLREGNGNPPLYSCLRDPTVDRGACWATVHAVAKS